MRRRPWILIVLAVFHILAPLGNIAFNAVISGRHIMNYFTMAMSPAYLSKNWVMIVAPIVAGLAIYACKKWSFYVYLASITALFAFSYLGFLSKGGTISLGALLLVYFINIAVVVYFLIPAVRNIYFDRRMRWWEAKPRYQCDFQAQWRFEEDNVFHPGEIGNISVNGLFLKSDIMPRDEDMVLIKVPMDTGGEAEFRGQVVFHGSAKKIGFGVQFAHDTESKNRATEITSSLDRQGRQIRNMEIRPEDSLSYWVRTLVTTGKGFIPTSKS